MVNQWWAGRSLREFQRSQWIIQRSSCFSHGTPNFEKMTVPWNENDQVTFRILGIRASETNINTAIS
jgi:hypothetical protein